MGFFKSLKNRVRSQVQNPNAPTVNPSPFLGAGRQRLAQMPNDFNTVNNSTFTDPRDMPGFGSGSLAPDRYMPDERAFLPETPVNRESKYLRGPSRLPQRMPQQGQSNRFFGGGLESIFERLPQRAPQRAPERRMPPNNRRNFMQMMASNSGAPLSNSMEEQRPMPSMAPMLPMSQEMPERNLLGRLPFQRPGFAEGEDVNTNMLIAEQAARRGESGVEGRIGSIKRFLGETGRTISNRDAELYGMGMLTLEDIISRATNSNMQEILGDSGRTISNMDRNLMQQEQMFFPDSGRTISDVDRNSLDDILQDLEKKN